MEARDGVQLFYRLVGTGNDTVVVLHGGPGFSMNYLAPDLEPIAADRVLLYYDQRGAGRSSLVTDSAALDAQRWADDLEAVRTHFGFSRVTLLAHSWGAGVAALYASRYPDRIERLLLVTPLPATRAGRTLGFQRRDARRDSVTQRRAMELLAARDAIPNDAATCRAFWNLWFVAYAADSAALRRSRGDYCSETPEALTNQVRNVDRFTMESLGEWDWRPALRSVSAPTLVIHGAADIFTLDSSREWAASVEQGRLLVLEGSGHFPYLEAPTRFFAASRAFLDRQWPAGAEVVR